MHCTLTPGPSCAWPFCASSPPCERAAPPGGACAPPWRPPLTPATPLPAAQRAAPQQQKPPRRSIDTWRPPLRPAAAAQCPRGRLPHCWGQPLRRAAATPAVPAQPLASPGAPGRHRTAAGTLRMKACWLFFLVLPRRERQGSVLVLDSAYMTMQEHTAVIQGRSLVRPALPANAAVEGKPSRAGTHQGQLQRADRAPAHPRAALQRPAPCRDSALQLATLSMPKCTPMHPWARQLLDSGPNNRKAQTTRTSDWTTG